MCSEPPSDWPHRAWSRTLQVGDVRWHVQVAGAGPVVLLLHGTGSSAHSWADVAPLLVPVATVVAPDLPGHGFTRGASLAALSLPRIAAALDGLLATLGLGPVALVAGHSAGAALAIRWALSTPRPARALVGFNPSLVPPPWLYTALLAPVVTPVATSGPVTGGLSLLSRHTALVGSLLDSTRSAIPVEQRRCYGRLFQDTAHLRGTLGFMAAADLPALVEDARRLAVPATFVLGARDAWVPERAVRRIVERVLPRAAIERWDDGHLLHEAQPRRAAALLRAVLARAQAVSVAS